MDPSPPKKDMLETEDASVATVDTLDVNDENSKSKLKALIVAFVTSLAAKAVVEQDGKSQAEKSESIKDSVHNAFLKTFGIADNQSVNEVKELISLFTRVSQNSLSLAAFSPDQTNLVGSEIQESAAKVSDHNQTVSEAKNNDTNVSNKTKTSAELKVETQPRSQTLMDKSPENYSTVISHSGISSGNNSEVVGITDVRPGILQIQAPLATRFDALNPHNYPAKPEMAISRHSSTEAVAFATGSPNGFVPNGPPALHRPFPQNNFAGHNSIVPGIRDNGNFPQRPININPNLTPSAAVSSFTRTGTINLPALRGPSPQSNFAGHGSIAPGMGHNFSQRPININPNLTPSTAVSSFTGTGTSNLPRFGFQDEVFPRGFEYQASIRTAELRGQQIHTASNFTGTSNHLAKYTTQGLTDSRACAAQRLTLPQSNQYSTGGYNQPLLSGPGRNVSMRPEFHLQSEIGYPRQFEASISCPTRPEIRTLPHNPPILRGPCQQRSFPPISAVPHGPHNYASRNSLIGNTEKEGYGQVGFPRAYQAMGASVHTTTTAMNREQSGGSQVRHNTGPVLQMPTSNGKMNEFVPQVTSVIGNPRGYGTGEVAIQDIKSFSGIETQHVPIHPETTGKPAFAATLGSNVDVRLQNIPTMQRKEPERPSGTEMKAPPNICAPRPQAPFINDGFKIQRPSGIPTMENIRHDHYFAPATIPCKNHEIILKEKVSQGPGSQWFPKNESADPFALNPNAPQIPLNANEIGTQGITKYTPQNVYGPNSPVSAIQMSKDMGKPAGNPDLRATNRYLSPVNDLHSVKTPSHRGLEVAPGVKIHEALRLLRTGATGRGELDHLRRMLLQQHLQVLLLLQLSI